MSGAGNAVIDALLSAGETALAHRLQQLQPSSPAQALVLRALGDAIARHGLSGVHTVAKQLLAALDGDKDVLLDLSDLRLASDTLAAFQRLEADQRSAARTLVSRIVSELEPVLVALIGALAA